MSVVWVKSRRGNEDAFKVDFTSGMDFADLKKVIISERKVLNLPPGAIEHVYNRDNEESKLRVGAKVPNPIVPEIGSSDSLPYFFQLTNQQQPQPGKKLNSPHQLMSNKKSNLK